MSEALSLGEYLVIASEVTGIPVEVLAKMERVVALADSALATPLAGWGGEPAYPDIVMQVAVLGEHLARNHPLPDGNKRSALLAMLLFAQRNGVELHLNEHEVISALDLLAAGRMSAQAFADYLRARAQ